MTTPEETKAKLAAAYHEACERMKETEKEYTAKLEQIFETARYGKVRPWVPEAQTESIVVGEAEFIRMASGKPKDNA